MVSLSTPPCSGSWGSQSAPCPTFCPAAAGHSTSLQTCPGLVGLSFSRDSEHLKCRAGLQEMCREGSRVNGICLFATSELLMGQVLRDGVSQLPVSAASCQLPTCARSGSCASMDTRARKQGQRRARKRVGSTWIKVKKVWARPEGSGYWQGHQKDSCSPT